MPPESISRELEELLTRYAGLVRSVTRRRCGDLAPLLMEDVEQEIRIAVWKYLESGREIANPYSFLVAIATRIALRAVRRARRGGSGGAEILDEAPVATSVPDVGEVEVRQALERALSELTPRRRAAVLAYIGGMNHEEVADFYGWTAAASRHAIYDGMASLRQYMESVGYDLS